MRYATLLCVLICWALGFASRPCSGHLLSRDPPPLLTTENGNTGQYGLYTFPTVLYGEWITHTFVLRNSGKSPITLQRIQSSCGCLTAVLGGGDEKHLPTLAPGATLSLQVTLDTAQMLDIISTPLLAGSETHKQVWVYTTADSLHPAVVLEMRGHIMSGVTIEPATLNFGSIGQAEGASRTVRVTYAAALYREGRTRLVAPNGSPLRVTPLSDAPLSGSPTEVVRSYQVWIAPHAPIGALSGQLLVEGLAARNAPSRSGKTQTHSPALTRRLPFVGQIEGSISAQPGTAVFGVVSLSSQPGNSLAARKERTLWILLKRKTSGASLDRRTAEAFWQGIKVRVDNAQFQATLVAPVPSGDGSANASPSLAPPPLVGGLQPGEARWLRLTLLPSAPRGKSLTAEALVTLPSGEKLRVPILAQTQ